MSKELIRAAGGIVHSDGNIFFTGQDSLNAYVSALAQRDELVAKYVAQPVQPAEYTGHDSDCSLHNKPAFPAGPCDCRLATEDVRRATLRKHIDHISLLEYQLQHQKERFDYMEMMYKTLPVIGVFAKLEDHEEILTQPVKPAGNCGYCDDTGDVHGIDGRYRGRCTCQAGQPAPVAQANHGIAHSLGGFRGGFESEHGRKPTEQEIWDHAIRSWRDLNPVAQAEPPKWEVKESESNWREISQFDFGLYQYLCWKIPDRYQMRIIETPIQDSCDGEKAKGGAA